MISLPYQILGSTLKGYGYLYISSDYGLHTIFFFSHFFSL